MSRPLPPSARFVQSEDDPYEAKRQARRLAIVARTHAAYKGWVVLRPRQESVKTGRLDDGVPDSIATRTFSIYVARTEETDSKDIMPEEEENDSPEVSEASETR